LITKLLSFSENKDIAFASFSKIITSVSNQESETKYRSIEKNIPNGKTIQVFHTALKQNLEKIHSLSEALNYGKATFYTGNVMSDSIKDIINDDSIDLIVTSPPYPNAFDYHLYHRFRIFWMGHDPREMAKNEIGSHLQYQRTSSGFERFNLEMSLALKNMYQALVPGRFAVLVLGDAKFENEIYKTAELISKEAEKIGFDTIDIISRNLPVNKRSMQSGKRATTEDILVIRKPNQFVRTELVQSTKNMKEYEVEINHLEIEALMGRDFNTNTLISSSNVDKLKKSTFYKEYFINNTPHQTWQGILESKEENKDRTEPKYLTHGIHDYKGKFYPQLIRPLINISKKKAGSKILDPFCGSGTVLLESVLNGYDVMGCDINPIAVKIASSKVNIIKENAFELEEIVSSFAEVLNLFNKNNDYSYVFHDDDIDEINSWFPKPVVNKLGFLLEKISEIPNREFRNFFEVIVSSIIRKISQQEPTDLRIRRRKESITDAPVFEMFIRNINIQIKKIIDFNSIKSFSPDGFGSSEIWLGSSSKDEFVSKIGENAIDLVITSPPYATALPYIDTNRLSLLILEGLNAKKRKYFEAEMTGTREISKGIREEYDKKIESEPLLELNSITAIDIVKKIYFENKDAEVGFRKKNTATLLYLYFKDMAQVFENIDIVTKNDSSMFFVIGDTKTTTGSSTVSIESTKVLSEIGMNLGWTLKERIPITVSVDAHKHMKNSITENTILWFEK
ncbi:DNA adenine methylase, partial [Enterococcus faecium]|nr:DNA adenine methylase [Enterococcus faecium]